MANEVTRNVSLIICRSRRVTRTGIQPYSPQKTRTRACATSWTRIIREETAFYKLTAFLPSNNFPSFLHDAWGNRRWQIEEIRLLNRAGATCGRSQQVEANARGFRPCVGLLRSVVDNRIAHVDVVTFGTEVCFFFSVDPSDSDIKTVPSPSRGCSRRLHRLKN